METRLPKYFFFQNAQHEINIINIKPGEIINYKIIIIKGSIINKSTCRSDEILLEHNSKRAKYKINNSQFIILIELDLYENQFKLTYCCNYSIKLTINYTPFETRYFIVPLYIICNDGCHNGKFQAPETENSTIENACKRINLCTCLLQSFIGEKLQEMDLGMRKTFQFKKCSVFHTKLKHSEIKIASQENLWNTLGREIMNSQLCNNANLKFLAFLSCSTYRGEDFNKDADIYEDRVKLIDGYVALGGGNLALIHTCCLYTWPEELSQVILKFQDKTLVDRTKFMDLSHKNTIGACFSSSLGSALHELCHIFDLGHTENGVMGKNFSDLYQEFVLNPKRSISRGAKYEKNTFFTRSCAVLLFYHR